MNKDNSTCCRKNRKTPIQQAAVKRKASTPTEAPIKKMPLILPKLLNPSIPASNQPKKVDDVVCTPDIMSMFTETESNQNHNVDMPQVIDTNIEAPPLRPFARREVTIRKNLQQIPKQTAVTVQPGITPVFHTINGFRIDLNSAAQQETYRLPNGKLIQVKKQIPGPGAAATTNSSSNQNVPPPTLQQKQPNVIPTVRSLVPLVQQVSRPNIQYRPANPQILNSSINIRQTIPIQQSQILTQSVSQPNPPPLLIRSVYPNTPVGNARTQFEARVENSMEVCQHIIGKINTLTNSPSYKTVKNFRDIKDLTIHLSYLLTYAIGRFKTLQEQCNEGMRKMGFHDQVPSAFGNITPTTPPAPSPVTPPTSSTPADKNNSTETQQKTNKSTVENAAGDEDDDDDDDVEIVETQTPLIDLDSDNEDDNTVNNKATSLNSNNEQVELIEVLLSEKDTECNEEKEKNNSDVTTSTNESNNNPDDNLEKNDSSTENVEIGKDADGNDQTEEVLIIEADEEVEEKSETNDKEVEDNSEKNLDEKSESNDKDVEEKSESNDKDIEDLTESNEKDLEDKSDSKDKDSQSKSDELEKEDTNVDNLEDKNIDKNPDEEEPMEIDDSQEEANNKDKSENNPEIEKLDIIQKIVDNNIDSLEKMQDDFETVNDTINTIETEINDLSKNFESVTQTNSDDKNDTDVLKDLEKIEAELSDSITEKIDETLVDIVEKNLLESDDIKSNEIDFNLNDNIIDDKIEEDIIETEQILTEIESETINKLIDDTTEDLKEVENENLETYEESSPIASVSTKTDNVDNDTITDEIKSKEVNGYKSDGLESISDSSLDCDNDFSRNGHTKIIEKDESHQLDNLIENLLKKILDLQRKIDPNFSKYNSNIVKDAINKEIKLQINDESNFDISKIDSDLIVKHILELEF